MYCYLRYHFFQICRGIKNLRTGLKEEKYWWKVVGKLKSWDCVCVCNFIIHWCGRSNSWHHNLPAHTNTHTGRIISMAVMLEADKHPEAGESEKDGTGRDGGLRLSLLNPADGQGLKSDQKWNTSSLNGTFRFSPFYISTVRLLCW